MNTINFGTADSYCDQFSAINKCYVESEDISSTTAESHIYNELHFGMSRTDEGVPMPNNAIIKSTGTISNVCHGFRTRHLSCIEEIDSDSLHSTSMSGPYALMQEADNQFKCLQTADLERSWPRGAVNESYNKERDEEYIEMIDESLLLDLDYYDEFMSGSKIDMEPLDFENKMAQPEDLWQSTVSEPSKQFADSFSRYMPEIMTTSCYGALNSSPCESESSRNVMFNSTPTKSTKSIVHRSQEGATGMAIYSTPDKLRSDCNREINLTQSQDSSFYNGMNTSLDLQSASMSGSLHGTVFPSENVISNAVQTAAAVSTFGLCPSTAEDLNKEIANKCISAAEQDLQSIKRLLECDARSSCVRADKIRNDRVGSGSNSLVCPSCNTSFDKGKRRKLIDICGHERCYACMFRNDQCPMCLGEFENGNTQGYDTGIGGSTSTISPLGSPQPQLRSLINAVNGTQSQNSQQHKSRHKSPTSTSTADLLHYSSVHNTKFSKTAIFTTSSTSGDVHHCNNATNFSTNNFNNNVDINNECTSLAAFATPPTRRRFFNHKNLRSAFGGHRRTASNGGFISSSDGAGALPQCIDSLSTLSIDNAVSAGDKQKEQLCARLGLLLDNEHNDNSISTSSSSNCSQRTKEQTVYASNAPTQEDIISLSAKLKICSTLSEGNKDDSAIKLRKLPVRRSGRTNGNSPAGVETKDNKRNAIYRPAILRLPSPTSITSPTAVQVQLPLKPLFFEVPLQESDPPFIGRQWLLRELSNLITNTETPGVLISGQPGTGKTSLILQIVEYSCFGRRKNCAASATRISTGTPAASDATSTDGIYCQINLGQERLRALASHIVGYHFCQADSNLTCLVPDFVHSLAAQLCQAPQLDAYRDHLLNEPHLQNILSLRECIADAERVMRMAILEPLITLKRNGKIPSKTCVILVDALCEAEYHRPDHGHTIATFLARMTQFFPCWLKVIATIRPQMVEFVQGLPYTRMTLDTWDSSDLLQKDLLDYITFRVNHSTNIQSNIAAANKEHHPNSNSQTKFITHLQALSNGSMLYVKLILDLIERGQLVIKSASYKVLPVSLAQIFLLHFNLRFPTAQSFERTMLILNVCLATLYPLTLNEIYYTCCATRTDADATMFGWEEFLARFRLLEGFLIKRIDNTYMFFHSSFREWLIRRDEGESNKFLCDFREGHAAIAFRLSRLQAPLDGEQTLELCHHMLKAHIYRNCQGAQSPRDLQAFWVASVSDSVSSALCLLRNVYSPNLKVSRLILLAGASPNQPTEFMGDATILCIAAHEGIVPMVSLLLEFGADVRLTNSQGCTPLILAAMRGHCDVVRLLVAAGSSLGQKDVTQRCAIVHAARTGRLNVVKYLMACDWTPRANSQDVSRAEALQQSLIAAAAQDYVAILEDLLEMDDIDVNALETTSGELPLTAAARNGCVDTLVILLARGAHVDGCNRSGHTSLWLASKEAHWAVAEKLLQHGASVNQASQPQCKTPLMIAAEEGHNQLIELLLERGAALEAQDNDGFTALSWACLRGHLTAAKILVEKGCHSQHADNNGRTALDLAAYQGSAQLVQYLLEQGANVEHVDVNGMRPLDRAIACRNTQVVQVFLRRGAKLGPTTWSMAMGKPEILIVLLNKLLEDGNVLYRKNRYPEAAHRYQYALRKISNLENLLERSAIFVQLRTNLLLNLSRCKRKMNELEESIDLATQAIQQKPNSYEGYYARAKARIELSKLNEALLDANEAIQKAIQYDSAAVQADVITVLKRVHTQIVTSIAQNGSVENFGCESTIAPTLFESRQQEMTDL